MRNKQIGFLFIVVVVLCSACSNPTYQMVKTSQENTGIRHVLVTEESYSNEIVGDGKFTGSLEGKKDEDSLVEANVYLTAATSPDGKYRIESFGVIKDVTAGGIYPAEGIRVVDNETEQVLWSMYPGYYAQTFLWSANNQYVAVNIETRISSGTFVIDTMTMTEIPLPQIEQVRESLKTDTSLNESRPDPYFSFLDWLTEEQLSVSFQWTGIDEIYKGTYIYDVTEKKLLNTILELE